MTDDHDERVRSAGLALAARLRAATDLQGDDFRTEVYRLILAVAGDLEAQHGRREAGRVITAVVRSLADSFEEVQHARR